MGFISEFLEHTKDTESPSSFWKWAAYTTIGAILRDNIWKPDGDTKIYANIYTLLLAESGYARKGRPVNLCTKMLRDVNNSKVISGRSSIQAITDELINGVTDKETGQLIKGGSAIFTAPELNAALVSDPATIGILTDIYDFHEKYPINLRGMGRREINNVVFSFFAASNEALLKQVYDSSAIQGGLLARTFLIIPNEFRPANSMLDFIDTSQSYKNLIHRLKEIAKLKGQIKITSGGRAAYDSWYFPFRESYKGKPDKSGVVSRIHTHILKLAMILAADELTLELTHKHIHQSIEECLSLLPNYNVFVMSSGKSNLKDAGAILLTDMIGRPKFMVSRREVLTKYWTDFDVETLDKLIKHLEEAEMLTTQHSKDNGMEYLLTTKCLMTMGKVPNTIN